MNRNVKITAATAVLTGIATFVFAKYGRPKVANYLESKNKEKVDSELENQYKTGTLNPSHT